jgi:5'-deoxynucleotidase YfbR-like HD superfamily hydrolase
MNRRFKELYEAGVTKRFHTKRTIHTQNVAEHSWGVAMILLEICKPSAMMLHSALTHDLAESVTGDTPATAKWASRELRESLEKLEDSFNRRLGIDYGLLPDEAECIKWADMLELIMYCQAEVDMGNLKMEGVVRAGIAYLDARIPPTMEASTFLDTLR